jgi:hypothetical protein
MTAEVTAEGTAKATAGMTAKATAKALAEETSLVTVYPQKIALPIKIIAI